jgi:hypothetical protein
LFKSNLLQQSFTLNRFKQSTSIDQYTTIVIANTAFATIAITLTKRALALTSTMSLIDPSELFPHPTLTAIIAGEKPNYSTLKTIHRQINANAMAIASDRGGGLHGHLPLVIPPAQFNAIPNTAAWVAPVHPGPTPTIDGANPTQHQINDGNKRHKAAIQEFKTAATVEAMLKRQIIAAIPDTFIKILKDEDYGYANVTTLTLLTHLDTTYGTVTPDDLDENIRKMNREWSPTQPLEDLWNQIMECRRFATAHDPISEAAAIRSAVNNLENSGVFTDALKEWRRKPVLEQTWDNLKTAFEQADKERRRNTNTAGEMGYANKAANKPNTDSNKENTVPSTMYYCWSHGYGSNPNHTGKTCTNPQTGHRPEATVENMMGGCCVIKRRMGERAVYKRPQRNPPSNGNKEEKKEE